MQGREEIFCDEASRMEMFRRILYRRMLPLLILIVGAFLPLSLMELLDAASAADALAIGIPAGLVRMSCGLESKEDLIDDIAQALEGV